MFASRTDGTVGSQTVANDDRTVTDNADARRFELRAGDEVLGWIDYLPAGPSVIFSHTEIAPAHEGQGLGSVLVRQALELMRERGTTIIPTCPFTAAYIQRHPDYADVVDPSLRARFA
jgi:predicted GNAT family acetyltransferase